MMEKLEDILKKDPIIGTAKANDIKNSPANIDDYYSLQAVTHMPIGKTNDYFEKLTRYYKKNKSTFIGGVWADYGLGKTSLIIYYWYKSQQENIFAIPPYAWDSLEDNLDVVYSWCKYKLDDKNLLEDIEEIYNEYKKEGLEDEIEKTKEELGIPYEKAKNYVNERVESGQLRVDIQVEELLDFYAEVSEVLKEGKYEGLLIFVDELQQTVDANKMTFRDMAGYLFDLADGMLSKNGDFGIFFGMPLSFHARLSKNRSDITDRINDRDCFINLGEMYSKDFAEKLWGKYVDKFELEEVTDDVVLDETLESINQVTDSTRRDLGNGPRSVISAFNMMVSHYKDQKTPYTPFDFVEDCLNGEIKLGDKSTFVKRVNELLTQEFVKDYYEFEKVVKFLSAFPRGTTKQIESSFDMRDSINKFIKETGGRGNVVSSHHQQGHRLQKLRREDEEGPTQDRIKENISYFYQTYAIDLRSLENATESFIENIISDIFQKTTSKKLNGWKYLNNWEEKFEGVYENTIKGRFKTGKKYPDRKIKIEVLLSENEKNLDKQRNYDFSYKNAEDPLDFVFRFLLNPSAEEEDRKGEIKIENDRIVKFYLNPFYYNETKNLPEKIDSVVEERDQIPFLFLNLLDHMEDVELDPDDADEWDFYKDKIKKIIIRNILNDGLLDIKNSDIELDNTGDILIKDLFYLICEKTYPNYETIMLSADWEKKVNRYKKVLSMDNIPLGVKRGNKPLEFREEAPPQKDPKKFSKEKIAEQFGLKQYSTFEIWMEDLKPLVDAENWKNNGEIYLKKHPVEKEIEERLDNSNEEEMFEGEKCKYINGKNFLNQKMKEGYRYDELAKILKDIGISRKLYDFDYSKRYVRIYQRPVSIEDKKQKLEKEFNNLSEDREKLATNIPDYEKEPIRDIEADVESADNEEEIEEVQARIENRRRAINNFIINHLENKIRKLKNESKRLSGNFNPKKGKIKRVLDSEFSSPASWRKEIEEIKNKLKKQRFNINGDITDLERKTEKLSEEINRFKKKYGDKDVNKFIDLEERVSKELENVKDELIPEVKQYKNHIEYLEKFLKIDELYKTAFEKANTIEQNLDDKSIKNEYENLSEELKIELEEKREGYLKRYENEKNKIQELIKKAKKKIKGFREEFLEQKEFLEENIKKIDSTASQIRTNFSEENVEESYRSLGDEVNEIFESIINNKIEKVKELQTEIEYIRDILGVEDEVENSELDKKARELESTLESLSEKFNSGIFSKPNEEKREEVSEIVEELDQNNKDIRNIIKKTRELRQPEKVDEEAKKLLDLVSEKKNLKEIILTISEQEEDIELEDVLEMLKRCFKKRQINIIVEKEKK